MDIAEEQRVKQVRMAVTRKIKDLGRAGKAREAVQQLAEMARLGVQPDSMLGTALVNACARSGHMQMAQAAFEELFGAHLYLCLLHVMFALLLGAGRLMIAALMGLRAVANQAARRLEASAASRLCQGIACKCICQQHIVHQLDKLRLEILETWLHTGFTLFSQHIQGNSVTACRHSAGAG